jgi:photosystem II stability/assembly factor-like uncharacterized protein
MNYIEMFNLAEGVAMGDAPNGRAAAFLRTNDGGASWKSMNRHFLLDASSGDVWRRVDFVNVDVGYFYCQTLVYKTTNGGASWVDTGFRENGQIMKFYDENIGLCISVYSSASSFSRTTNGGKSWEKFQSAIVSDWGWGNDIEFLPGDPSKVWFTDWNRMVFSSDTGRTWTVQELDSTKVGGRDIAIPDKSCGWIACDNGRVYRTSHPDIFVSTSELLSPFPSMHHLSQNYPNPFNPSTSIKYELPKASDVRLSVYDMLGREVSVLVDERKDAGVYEVKFDGSNLASGVYFYRLHAGDFVQSKRLVLLK